jgi:fibronectin type 3 domain-containing protein
MKRLNVSPLGLLVILFLCVAAQRSSVVAQAPTGALQFAFSDQQYVSFGQAPALGAGTFTLELWFKRLGNGQSVSTGGGNFVPLITKGRGESDGNTRDMNYFLGINPTTNVLMADLEEGATGASPGANHPIMGVTPIENGIWYHAAATYDGTWRLYLNGVLEAQLAVGQPPRADSIQHAALATGLDSTGTPGGYFTGIIDEARIWNYARSQAEIRSGKGQEIQSAQGLVGRWGLNDGTGTIAFDSSASGLNGELRSNAATPVLPSWVAGLPFGAAAPPAPVNVSASPGNGLVTVVWPASTANGLTGYNVYRSTNPGVVPANAQPLNGPTPIASPMYTDHTVTNGTTYFYVVTALTLAESAASGEVSATPQTDAGAALRFSGQTSSARQYVTFGAAPGLNTPTFTLETWFKRTSDGSGTSTGGDGIADLIPLIAKGRAEQVADGSNKDMNFALGIQASTGLLAADFEDVIDGGNHPVFGVTPIPIDGTVWHHAAATYDGSAWRLYLDGILEGSLSVGTISPRSDSIQHASLATAMDSTGTPSGAFAGILDEARVWNYARTQAEVMSTMRTQVAAAPGLLARWGLNEAVGAAAGDTASSAPIVGTLVGTPEWVAGYPFSPDVAAPAAPVGLTAVPATQKVMLEWSANTEADLAGYNLYRSTTTPVLLANPLNGASLLTTTTFVDDGLTNGVTYHYVVTAVDIFGNVSLPSNDASATPQLADEPPVVSAGPDRAVALPDIPTFEGTATDDGLPAPLTVVWDRVSGPATVVFGTPNAATTTVMFSVAGSYVLRLTANDGAQSVSDTVAVEVSDPILVGAGDIVPDCVAGNSVANAEATATLLDDIPGTIFTLGDNQYQSGTAQQFADCYQVTWGRHKARIRPAVGNHEFNADASKDPNAPAAPYYDYFNGSGVFTGPAGDRDKGYYSYDLPNWHVVVLNSECGSGTEGLWLPGGCAAGSAQEQWLRADLAAAPTNNIVAIWHKPRFSSTASDGSISYMQVLWTVLYEYGVDIVLGGHWHNYERLAPTNASGVRDDAFGLRQFIVGTGGIGHRSFGTVRSTSEVRDNTSFGVLKLTLHANSYDWQFVPTPGSTLADSGSSPVHGMPSGSTNRAPTVTNPGNKTSAEGASVALQIQASDPDGNTLTYSATGLPKGLSINTTTGLISGTVGFDAAGTTNVAVSASDGALSATAAFTWTVTNTNRPPAVTNPGNQTTPEGTSVTRTISASDPDGDTLAFSATGLPPGLGINAGTGVISGTIPVGAAGTYSVVVTVGDGASTGTASFTWTVTRPAPSAPTGLAATAVSSSQIALAWTDTSNNEDGFRIERSLTTGNGNFVQVATVPANARTFTDQGLSASTRYYYRVRAFNATGTSAYSSVVNATTLTATGAVPAAPTGLAATAGSGAITVRWTDQSSNESGFRVERSSNGTDFTTAASVGANVTSYVDSGLSEATTLSYRAVAFNAAGASSPSNTASATTPLNAPSGLAGTATTTTVTLRWSDNSAVESGVQIERSSDGGTTYVRIATAAANATSYPDSGLIANTSYRYRVRATDAAGHLSAFSNTLTIKTARR